MGDLSVLRWTMAEVCQNWSAIILVIIFVLGVALSKPNKR